MNKIFDKLTHPPIICLCGSTTFKDEFIEINKLLTLCGYIVLSVGFFINSDEKEITRKEKAQLDILHLAKIDLADAIYVIDKNKYIGESTEREIEYARVKKKSIFYYSKLDLKKNLL